VRIGEAMPLNQMNGINVRDYELCPAWLETATRPHRMACGNISLQNPSSNRTQMFPLTLLSKTEKPGRKKVNLHDQY
jgi:hypothetical protein